MHPVLSAPPPTPRKPLMALVRERRLPQLTLNLDHSIPADPSSSSSSSSSTAAADCRLRCPLPPVPPPASTSSSSTLSSEYRLSDFDKLRVLGSGNGGVVYKVRHRRTAAVYALKFLQAAGPDSSVRRLPSREADIHRCADHPSVVRCHAVLTTPTGDSALVLELMDAGCLDSLLHGGRGGAPVPEPALASVARQALAGLTYLHAHHVAHRDIKPANLLVNSAGEIKVGDFGVSKVVRRALDTCPSYVGTCAYMSPERFDPESYGWSFDAYAGDIWGLGLTLMELHLGRFPLLPAGQRPDWAALMCAICFGDPPVLPSESGASPEFRDFVARCLQKEPSKRWTAAQLLAHPFIAGYDPAESDSAFRQIIITPAEAES